MRKGSFLIIFMIDEEGNRAADKGCMKNRPSISSPLVLRTIILQKKKQQVARKERTIPCGVACTALANTCKYIDKFQTPPGTESVLYFPSKMSQNEDLGRCSQ
jgi:hypothetical protein